jgi:hypothetical protein
MQAQEACRIVNALVFRPGWKFRAAPYTDGNIAVQILYTAQDTDYPPLYDGPTITTGPVPAVIRVSQLDEDGLLAAVKRQIEIIHDHEDREYLRRGDVAGYPAPFHPHDIASEQRWRSAKRQALYA